MLIRHAITIITAAFLASSLLAEGVEETVSGPQFGARRGLFARLRPRRTGHKHTKHRRAPNKNRGPNSSCGPDGCGPQSPGPGSGPGSKFSDPGASPMQPSPPGNPAPAPHSACGPRGCGPTPGMSSPQPYAPVPNGMAPPGPRPNPDAHSACGPNDNCGTPPAAQRAPEHSPYNEVVPRPQGASNPFERALEVFQVTSVSKLTDAEHAALKGPTFSMTCQKEPLSGSPETTPFVARIKPGDDEDRLIFRRSTVPGERIEDSEYASAEASMPMFIEGRGLVAKSADASKKFELKVLGTGAVKIVAIRATDSNGENLFCLDNQNAGSVSQIAPPPPSQQKPHQHGDGCKH